MCRNSSKVDKVSQGAVANVGQQPDHEAWDLAHSPTENLFRQPRRSVLRIHRFDSGLSLGKAVPIDS
jgi:hypothetical protein